MKKLNPVQPLLYQAGTETPDIEYHGDFLCVSLCLRAFVVPFYKYPQSLS